MKDKGKDGEKDNRGISSSVLGQAFWLVMQSRSHEFMFVKDLQSSLFPALALKQFAFVSVDEKNPQVQAMALWAFVNEEVDERLSRGVFKLQPGDWNSGKITWLIDVLAPFGGSHLVIKELREKVFPKGEIKSYIRDPKTGEAGVQMIYGIEKKENMSKDASKVKKKS